jgi:hypothetical protein
MTAERRQILDMLAAGKITSEDAERLLAKLDEAAVPEPRTTDAAPTKDGPAGPLPRYLRVLVDSADGDKVNVRVPLALVRTGIKLTALMPTEAAEKLHDKGVDLAHFTNMDAEELSDALRELSVDVDSEDGDTVRVFCE